MIKNIIFDIGNVLADFRWREMLLDKGFEADMVERIAQASVLTPVWREYDRGVWTDEEVMKGFIQNDPEIEDELRCAYADFYNMVTIRDYAIPWVEELKAKGYHVFYLSNYPHKAEVDCPEALAFIPHMDGGILSYRDRVVKPDAEIYKLLLSRYGLVAEECVFMDDTLENVEAAEKLGIYGIHFTTKEAAEAELAKMGVK